MDRACDDKYCVLQVTGTCDLPDSTSVPSLLSLSRVATCHCPRHHVYSTACIHVPASSMPIFPYSFTLPHRQHHPAPPTQRLHNHPRTCLNHSHIRITHCTSLSYPHSPDSGGKIRASLATPDRHSGKTMRRRAGHLRRDSSGWYWEALGSSFIATRQSTIRCSSSAWTFTPQGQSGTRARP